MLMLVQELTNFLDAASCNTHCSLSRWGRFYLFGLCRMAAAVVVAVIWFVSSAVVFGMKEEVGLKIIRKWMEKPEKKRSQNSF